eukprot:SAG11_NODE_553_length_8575_cov_18.074328_5_plen_136_part_00
MKKAWPDEPGRCSILCGADATEEESAATEKKILIEEIQTYREKGWSSIAALYGVDAKDRPVRCRLPPVYALVKLKAIMAASPGRKVVNVLKGRPIGPHTKHPLKNLYNRVATGQHFVLTSISQDWATSLTHLENI